MKKPIKPVAVKKTIPDEVMEVFNNMIQENWNGDYSVLMQNKVVARIISKFKESNKKVSRHDVFEKGWLNVETSYRKLGWTVAYDKPSYDENYEAHFIFSK